MIAPLSNTAKLSALWSTMAGIRPFGLISRYQGLRPAAHRQDSVCVCWCVRKSLQFVREVPELWRSLNELWRRGEPRH